MFLVIYVLTVCLGLPNNAVSVSSDWSWQPPNTSSKARHIRHILTRPMFANHAEQRQEEYSLFLVGGSKEAPSNHKPFIENCGTLNTSIEEQRPKGTFVTQIKASDKDPIQNGGKLRYSFLASPGQQMKFAIDPETGIIKTLFDLDSDKTKRVKNEYLTVRVTDNGSPQLEDMCTFKVTLLDVNDKKNQVETRSNEITSIASRQKRHVLPRPMFANYAEQRPDEYSSSYGGSSAEVVSNHKPFIENCATLNASIKEQMPKGTVVTQIQASDKDPIENGGKISYTFLTPPRQQMKFTIDAETGIIRTLHELDRDEPTRDKNEYLTVRATDNGRPQLEDVCTFKVTLLDVNDNSPQFDKVFYYESVPQDLLVNKEVMRISATDFDDGKNSALTYQIEAFSNSEKTYFRIDRGSGIIFLNRSIDKDPGYAFKLRATSSDSGDPPLSTSINVTIQVVESNKKAPTFTEIPSSPIVLLENLTDFSYNIATLRAQSNTDESAPVFELVQGRTEQTNKLNTFRLESEGTVAHIRLGRQMDYESISEYTLTIRIQNKYKLGSETSITIQLKDVNDNIPVFTEVLTGVVLEDEPPGTPVMQVRAIDADSTTMHNQVIYELADNQDNFAIDRYTGNITTLKEFDREEQDFYNVKVIATDNSPSALYNTGAHNRGEQVFRIEIADKNDHPPKFNQTVYVPESVPEDANLNAFVAEVIAEDNDTASVVSYTIIDGNEGDAFAIDEKTGKITVHSSLDYEKKTSYTLSVRAFDSVYDDYCKVEIKVENVNDNPPVFLKHQRHINITEEEMVPGCIAQLEAYDPDIPDRSEPQHIVYNVVKPKQKLLTINEKGCLSLIKPLDRDPPNGYDNWQVIISASDEDGVANSHYQVTTEINITLLDINDNAPYLDILQPVVWRENKPPGEITRLSAKDNDSPENGPPFTFTISRKANHEIQTKFSITEGNSLRSLVSFDREEYSSYMVPIEITDSGIPSMTGTSTLKVIIGDHNDNKMKKGHSEIFAYNFMGEAPDTEIGRVYVEDPDDWDLPDKHFEWEESDHQYFRINYKTGMITMLQGTTEGSFLLRFKVTEQGEIIQQHSVIATVNVTVKTIPKEAVDKSGSVRFTGISPEEFVETKKDGVSKHALFRKRIAEFMNISIDNVDVFTVLHSTHHQETPLLDVRFSAHGSPYYSPEKLNAIISAKKPELQRELDVKIYMINIDECLVEHAFCPNSSCSNLLTTRKEPIAVFTNRTTFVGVRAEVQPFCSCPERHWFQCLNGGTLVEERRCECPKGYDGPQCEIVSIGFDGKGWALYQPFEACEESHVSLEVVATSPDGLIFYIGPTVDPDNGLYVQDFMALELQNGYPVLLVDFGTGTVRINEDKIRLDDGRQHLITIIWSKMSIEVQVDDCKSDCLSIASPRGPNEFLNVNGPLQVGGAMSSLDFHYNWTHRPTQQGFTGCVKNFTFNGKLYDLGHPGAWANVDIGCNTGITSAVTFGIDTSFLIAILVCLAVLLILLLAVVVHRRKTDDLYKDNDDIRENIINYEDEGGGEGDMTAYDLNVLRLIYDDSIQGKDKGDLKSRHGDEVPDISGFLDGKKQTVDNDPDTNPFDDVRHYAYEGGDGNSTGSLSSLASGTDDGDLNFDYLSNFGPRFRKLADMYGEDPSDEEDESYQNTASESWC